MSEIDLSKYDYSFSLKNKIGRVVWSIVWIFLFRPFNLGIFNKWRAVVLKMMGAKVDITANVYATVRIWAPWNLTMGKYACLGPYVDCYNQGAVSIGDNTTISQKAYICASSHDISDPKNTLILDPVIIEDQAWIAADAFVGPGVVIGQGAVVGARSAVFKEVPAWSVVGGNPAKFLKKREINS